MKAINQKGAAVVEFALILPMLLTLVFGIIEMGFLFYNKAVLTNASREGARAGITFNSSRLSQGQIQALVNGYLSDKLVSFGAPRTAVVTTDPADTSSLASGAGMLTVSVSYLYDFLLLPSFVTDLAGSVNLTVNTTMRAE